MPFGPGLGMRLQKMVEDVEQDHNMLLVVTRLAGADVIDNHVADFFRPVLLARKILGKSSRRDLGHMLVLRDGENLFFGKAAQGDTVLKRDHGQIVYWLRAPVKGVPNAVDWCIFEGAVSLALRSSLN